VDSHVSGGRSDPEGWFSMTDGSVSNPAARATTGRRKGLAKAWRSTEWVEQKAVFLKEHPYCEMHMLSAKSGEVLATIPHHPFKTSYKEGYTDLELSQCVALCVKCHFATHHGMTLCKTCAEHYHPWDAPECKRCNDKRHPELVVKREAARAEHDKALREKKAMQAQKRKEQKSKSRCKFFGAGQKCRFRAGAKCPHAPTKAPVNCVDFEAKKGVKK
jgi:hypothetical protein